MAAKPTIQLRTIFVIFVCAAIGLTCATAIEKEVPGNLALNILRPRQNLYHFLLYTSAAVMAGGLIQQIRALARLRSVNTASGHSLWLAWLFAISWRTAIAVALCISAVGQVLLAHEKIHLPESDMNGWRAIFPDMLVLICAIVVLSNGNNRWSTYAVAKERWWTTALAFLGGAVILALMLRDTGLITFLVHIATQGIERAQRGQFQRPDTFPDQAKEGFRLFWLSAFAVVDVVVAAAALALGNAARSNRWFRIAFIALYIVAVAAAGAFCVWYHSFEFRRVSPDFADSGLASSWVDRLTGLALASIVVTAIAWRTATRRDTHSTDTLPIRTEGGRLDLHEYAVFIILLVAAPVVYIYELLRRNLNDWDMRLGWQQQLLSMLADYLAWPETYIYLAVLALGIRLLWQRWRQQADAPASKLTPLDARQFAWSWVALALLAAVGLPTLSIFSFTYWLGPWYLHGAS